MKCMNIRIFVTISQGLNLKASYAMSGVDSSVQWFRHVLLSMNESVQAKSESVTDTFVYSDVKLNIKPWIHSN